MNYVIDANIAVGLFIDLGYSAKARTILANAQSILAPDLIIHETTNSLWKLVRVKQISRDFAYKTILDIPMLFSEIADGRKLARAALDYAIALDHPGYDCFYVALAEERQVTFLTADRKLLRRLEKLDRPVRHKFIGAGD